MKRSGKLAVALVAFAAVGAAVTIPALAHGPQGGGWAQGAQGGPGAMMGGWQGGPGGMMGGPQGGPGAMMGNWQGGPGGMIGGGHGGPGPMMGGGHGGPGMMRGPGGYGGMGPGAMGPAMMGNADFMEHMMEMHSQMGGLGGPGMMGGSFGPGMMGGPGGPGMMGALFGDLDADGDGTVTTDEARDGLQAALAEYDANGDGTLSLDEFEALHGSTIRPMTVDRFQALDADGDGQVTQDEFTAPADWMAQMQTRRAAVWQDCPWLQDSSEAAEPEGNN